jgi:hypothetical protein
MNGQDADNPYSESRGFKTLPILRMMMSKIYGLPPCWLMVAALAAGCGDARQGAVEIPPPDIETSKAALISSLDAWKADRQTSGVLMGSKPSIGVVDATRSERPLLAYEVIGPLMVVEKARPFAVRLVLGAPRETVTTRYLVLGKDPLWVFRQEDFERMIHWEHKMDGDEATGIAAKPNPPSTSTNPTTTEGR